MTRFAASSRSVALSAVSADILAFAWPTPPRADAGVCSIRHSKLTKALTNTSRKGRRSRRPPLRGKAIPTVSLCSLQRHRGVDEAEATREGADSPDARAHKEAASTLAAADKTASAGGKFILSAAASVLAASL